MRHDDRRHRPSRTNKAFRPYHTGPAFTAVLLLATVFSGSAAALDINSSQSLQYYGDGDLDFEVAADGVITASNNLSMGTATNNITDFFDTTACATDQFVTRLYANGSYQCTDASSIDTTVADDQNLSEVLAQGNVANQTIEFNGGIMIGDSSTTYGSNTNAVAVGKGADASGPQVSAVGYDALASGGAASAFGSKAYAVGSNASAFGPSADASDGYTSAFGSDAEASGRYASAVGYSAEASGYLASAFGSYADATADYALAVGYSAEASGDDASAFGYSADASGSGASAFGRYADAFGVRASAFGHDAYARAEGAVAIGYESNAWNQYEATFGNLNGQELDVNVTGNMTVHGSGGLDVLNGSVNMNGNNLALNGGYLSNDGGNEGLQIDNSGNVGIGSATPQGNLHVNTSTGNATFRLSGTKQANRPIIQLETGGYDSYILQEDNRFKIGTEGYRSTGNAALTIDTTNNVTIPNGNIDMSGNGVKAVDRLQQGTTRLNLSAEGNIPFQFTGTDNVAGPDQNGSGILLRPEDNNGNQGFELRANNSTDVQYIDFTSNSSADYQGRIRYGYIDDGLELITNKTPAMTLSGSQNVDIPNGDLQVSGDIDADSRFETRKVSDSVSDAGTSNPVVYVGQTSVWDGPMLVDVYDKGADEGAGVRYYISTGFGDTHDTKVIAFGENDEFPVTISDINVYVNNVTNKKKEFAFEHTGGSGGKSLQIEATAYSPEIASPSSTSLSDYVQETVNQYATQSYVDSNTESNTDSQDLSNNLDTSPGVGYVEHGIQITGGSDTVARDYYEADTDNQGLPSVLST